MQDVINLIDCFNKDLMRQQKMQILGTSEGVYQYFGVSKTNANIRYIRR
jgi:hypothetical protein